MLIKNGLWHASKIETLVIADLDIGPKLDQSIVMFESSLWPDYTEITAQVYYIYYIIDSAIAKEMKWTAHKSHAKRRVPFQEQIIGIILTLLVAHIQTGFGPRVRLKSRDLWHEDIIRKYIYRPLLRD